MNKISFLLPLALLTSGAVNAADQTENPWYVGARIGSSHSAQFENIPAAIDPDRGDVAGGVFLGHNFTPALAFETGYTYLGDINYATHEGIDLVGKLTFINTESFDIYAKAGGFYFMTEGQDAYSSLDDKGIALTAGLGIEKTFTENLSARLEYQYYDDVELDEADWNTHFLGVSLIYGWGAKDVMPEPAPVPATPKPIVKPEPIVVEKEKMVEMVKIEPLTIALPFMTDSDELPQIFLNRLKPIAQHLIDYPEAKLYVVGHTDSTGTKAYNQKLSERRAALVGTYLSEKFNIDKSRIVEEGHGELDPKASNDTLDGRAANRRVSVYTPGLTVEEK